MQNKSKLQILYTILVLMVAQAHCQQLMCYICDDCNKITQNTPKEVCDESYFNKIETTQTPPTTLTVTTDEISTTSTEGTTEPITSETPISTQPPMPTAGTAGPPLSTTSLPTPPNPGTVPGVINAAETEFNSTTTPIPTTTSTTEQSSTNGTPETTFLKPVGIDMQAAPIIVRQRRNTGAADTTTSTTTTTFNPLVSFHCYLVQKTINGTSTTSRGCSRVNQTEAVCPQLELTFNNTKFDKCTPCSNSLCNGSHVFGVSIVAVILGLVSAFLLGFPA